MQFIFQYSLFCICLFLNQNYLDLAVILALPLTKR